MTAAEFNKLYSASSRRLRQATATIGRIDPLAELRLACSILTITMLLTSSPLARAKTLSVRDEPPERIENDVIILAKNVDDKYSWFMKPSRPERKPIPLRHISVCFLDTEIATLPVNQELAHLLHTSFFLAEKAIPAINAEAFTVWLGEIDKTSRISEAMVTDWLLLRLLFEYADIAAAAVIVCRQGIGEGSRAHYTCLSRNDIRRRYVAVIAAIHCSDRELLDPPSANHEDRNPAAEMLGARYLPSAASLRAQFRRIRGEAPRTPPIAMRDIVHRHNGIVVNTYLGLALSVAARPDNELLESVKFNSTLTWVCVDEKIAPDSASARFVALPAGVTRQVRTTIAHCRRMRHFLRCTQQAPVDAIYLLDESLRAVPLAGRAVQAEIDRYFPFPLQAIRRFVRSTFVRRRIPSDQIDLQLGHSHFGQEPHRQTSSLNFLDAAIALRSNSGRLLHQLGFRPLDSWLG
jgi:hypothetical protein